MRADPVAGIVADPQSLNRYAYVSNDPVNLVDPLGLYLPGRGVAGSNNSFDPSQCYTLIVDGIEVGTIGNCGAGGGGQTGGGGGGGPQNPTPTDQLRNRAQELHDQPNRNDCLALVELIRVAAKLFPNIISATNALGVVLTGAGFYELAIRSGAGHNVQAQVSFGNNGFRTELAGTPGDNQVRHFTGGLLVGETMGESAGLRQMNARERGNGVNEIADRNLNGISVPLGADLQGFNGEYGLTPGSHQAQKLNELADAVRNRGCKP